MHRSSGRFPSSRELGHDGDLRNQRETRTPHRHDERKDESQETSSSWTQHSRPTNRAFVGSAPRHHMAWMLAHAPEYNHWGENNDVERTDFGRLRLDSPIDSTTWRRTGSSRHEPTDIPRATVYREPFRSTTKSATDLSQTLPRDTYDAVIQRSSRGYLSREGHDETKYTTRHDDVPSHEEEDEIKSRSPTVTENQQIEGTPKQEDDDDSDSGSVNAYPEIDPEAKAEINVPKTSRYLREMDRRIILERLAQGEKQATLAKEFNVSRAAISNLYKHREAILARTDEDPHAKHPKKKKRKTKINHDKQPASLLNEDEVLSPSEIPIAPRTAAAVTPFPANTSPSEAPSASSTLLIARSRALPLLLSTMSDSSRSLSDFKRTAERALWLLLEDALAVIPVERSQTDYDDNGVVESVVAQFPSCAISMEQDTLDATPMLDIFQLMEPRQPFGVATVRTEHNSLIAQITDVGLPHRLRGYNVFVLDVVAGSGESVCVTIESLLRRFDAVESNVAVVALFTSSEVVAMVQCTYPQAKIVTARIDSSITRRRVASTPVDLILQRMRQVYTYSC